MPHETDLDARLTVLEDIEKIKKLKAQCCLYVDKHDAEGFASLFTDDGAFIGAFQQHQGRAALRNVQFWPFMVHFVSNPIIEVKSQQEATGTWYFLRAYTAPDGEACWAAGLYHDEYSKAAGEWCFKSVRITNFFACRYDVGWGARQQPAHPDA